VPNKQLYLEDPDAYKNNFFDELRTQFTIVFGFWGDDPPRPDYSNSFWLFMILSCFFIVIIMMNLLIAITTGIY